MNLLKPGQIAPPLKLLDQNEAEVTLSDFKGRKVLLYFYPKALTPGCTTQACAVSNAKTELDELNVVPLAISPDKPALLKRFEATKSLNFTLLSDPEHTVAEAYGVWQEKKMYGKAYMGILRSAFLINENGVITHVWYKISPAETVPAAIKAAMEKAAD
ncbi:MAG: thioredoxin-dependent thiol peroxidase [Kiritimatiellia bacterium]